METVEERCPWCGGETCHPYGLGYSEEVSCMECGADKPRRPDLEMRFPTEEEIVTGWYRPMDEHLDNLLLHPYSPLPYEKALAELYGGEV